MGAKKNSESEVKVMKRDLEMLEATCGRLAQLQEERIIALERGLEGVLRRLEASTSPDDEAGWYGRPE